MAVRIRRPTGDYIGLSTDARPTGLPDGTEFRELDTATSYIYAADTATWHELPAEGGGGGGLTLGPPTNSFTAATKAAAETARDTYATANADWLAQYDEESTFLISVNWPATPTNTVYQSRRADSWADVTPLVRGKTGTAGAAGADSTVAGPAGAAGADGADSTVPGPAGAAGAASTVPGPDGGVGPIGPVGPGAAGTPITLSRFESLTTARATAQGLSASYASILEFAATDIFVNEGGFTVETVGNVSTITVPNSGLFKITAHIKVVTTGSIRSQLEMRANVLRSGVVVPNSATIMAGAYVRAITGAMSSIASGTTTLLLGAGDTIVFQMREEVNTANTYTFGGSDSVVELVEIPSQILAVAGTDGATGPAGADGADGAGAAPAQDEGTQVVATPTAYNFVGDGVVVTDVGGVATVTIAGGGGNVPTHTDQYLAGKATSAFVAADFTGTAGVAYADTAHTATMPTVTGNVFGAVARLATDPAPTFADVNGTGTNQIADFTQQAGTVTLDGAAYDVWVSDYAVFSTGDEVEFR